MPLRQTSGSVVCPSCGKLVGVHEAQCWNCGRRNPGMWGFAPVLRRFGNDLGFVPIVMGACVVFYVATLIADTSGITNGGLLSILAPSPLSLFAFGASGPVPVFQFGRWWTVLSAGWLHGNLLHIAFNLLWVRQLAPACAELYGAARMVIIYTVASVVGFVFSTMSIFAPTILHHALGGGGYTVGASAAIMGLLGAMVHYGRKGSSAVSGQAWTYAVIFFVFGFVMRGTDNWAHLGGFLGGYAMGAILNPLKPERGDHLLAALLCLALSFGSVIVSFVTGLQLLHP